MRRRKRFEPISDQLGDLFELDQTIPRTKRANKAK
jgi:hypothetical protein